MPRRRARALAILLMLVAVPLGAAGQAQSGLLNLPIDVTAVATWALRGLAVIIGTVFLLVLKAAVAAFNGFKQTVNSRFDEVDESIAKVQRDVQTTKQELFGATGGNGIRGELREIKADARSTKELVAHHTTTLALLAQQAGLPPGDRR